MVYKKYFIYVVTIASALNLKDPNQRRYNLPINHIKLYQSQLNNYMNSCWGYENECLFNHSYTRAYCPDHHRGWVSSKIQQLNTFFNQADFGYVKIHRQQLQNYCASTSLHGSTLECSGNLLFCRSRNIMIDFRRLKSRKEPVRYHMDVLKSGEIRGNCRLNRKLLLKNLEFMSPLQSWAPELQHFTEFEQEISKTSPICDLWVDESTIITKIDASVSMYHHFCDFFNIYASQHVNSSGPESFHTNTRVLIWETYPYVSNFGVTWNAFTQNPIWNLNQMSGKRVCFRDVMFPLLPRMIFGLYYNTPIIWGCKKSGLFRAFSEHILHRLKIPDNPELRRKNDNKVNILFISRKTKHRQILNENDLLTALRKNERYRVRQVQFSHSDSFLEQLKQDQWADILIGMHGSGLTHALFLPDWATVIELYNCGDENCYKDLSRLRGVNYLTWEDGSKVFAEDEGHHPSLGAHEKFTNYRFDVEEFLKLVEKGENLVLNNPEWKNRFKNQENKKEEL